MTVSKELMDILACPKCKGEVELEKDGNGIACGACRLRYRVEDGIPIMLIDEAESLDN